MNDENSQRAGVGDLSNSEERRESLADDNKDATEQSMLHTHSPLFELHLYNARELVSILKALCFREIQMCTFSVINNQVQVDDDHTQLGIAYLKNHLFSDFNLKVPSVKLRFQLQPLLEALNFFNSNNTHAVFKYQRENEPLEITIEDDRIVCQFRINQQRPQPALDLNFDEDNVLCKLIMKPKALHDIIRDLDIKAEVCRIKMTNEYISFYTNGSYGCIKTQIGKKGNQISLLECLQDSVHYYYRLNHLRRLLGILSISTKVSLRIDENGVLCVQSIVSLLEQQSTFVEFYILQENDLSEQL